MILPQIIILVWIGSQAAGATAEMSLISEGDRAYAAGRFAEARELYSGALNSVPSPAGGELGALLFRLGNCSYRMERYAEAIWYYRRAARHGASDERIRFNVGLCRYQLGTESRQTPSFIQSLEEFVEAIPPARLLLLVTVTQIVGLTGLLLLRRRPLARILAGLVILVALLGAARLVRDQWLTGRREAIVLDARLAAHAEPHEHAPVLFELGAGQSVRVEEMSDRWARLDHPLGGGWVRCQGLGLVE